ncbi:LacI family DNA-binding transcriptional regulator [Burkholderiaceae bacterium UC74_6]
MPRTALTDLERPHPTLRMVAQASGVSITTASRVINNSPHVRAAKRAAVQAAIAKLGFVPNGIAKSLVRGRSNTVGLVAQFFESPFYARLLRSVEETLSTQGYGLVVASGHWNRREEEQCVATLRERHVDGIIVLTGSLDDGFLKSLASDLPVVVTGRDLEAPGLHALRSDDHQGALAATRHLLQLGHRRIAHIAGAQNHADAHERERGYRDALTECGVAVDPELIVQGDYLEEGGAQALERLLARGIDFTAVFAANDQMATGATQVLFRRGLRVPADVSVVGFDDLLAAKYASPPRTSVNLSVAELGRRAALAMLDLLAGRKPTVGAPMPELVVRGSTHPVS